ncbi:hypothetical protein Q75_13765 [Bacillus coahuilensis p1.1.43]|uniref:ABC transmembrane type-1 domain-containing protein n=1 Tax=Bacillus coahuilensis p1.1.43 TaxID=1150625 RepID=A0A147K5J2_9BACI|nr:hypothetical protein [Bacillus coahuilensis]KUP04897.1 hypothetical protein Q75_13765 [Bacillus coahuilensis p1.1.43]
MKWWKNHKTILLLTPAAVILFSLTGYSLWMAINQSISYQGETSLFYYKEVVSDEAFWSSLLYSFRIAFFSSAVSLLIGLWLTRTFYTYVKQGVGKLFVWLPMLFPHFVGAYLTLLFLGQSGILSHIGFELGFITEREQFPILVRDEAGVGIFLTYLWKEIPFVVLMLLPVYDTLNRQVTEEVRMLGGSHFQAFKVAEWPWLVPTLLETGLILFMFIFAAFEVPFLLGVTYPKMFSILAYDWFYSGNWENRGYAFASLSLISGIILLITLFLFWVIQKKRWLLAHGKRAGGGP